MSPNRILNLGLSMCTEFFIKIQKIRTCFKLQAYQALVQRGPNCSKFSPCKTRFLLNSKQISGPCKSDVAYGSICQKNQPLKCPCQFFQVGLLRKTDLTDYLTGFSPFVDMSNCIFTSRKLATVKRIRRCTGIKVGHSSPTSLLPTDAVLQCTLHMEGTTRGVLPIMANTGRLRPKGLPFSGFGYMQGQGFHKAGKSIHYKFLFLVYYGVK